MDHERDVRSMSKAAADRTQRAREAALDAIKRLQEESLPIDFQAVSNASGCSKSFLYRHPDIKALIEAARIEKISADMPAGDATPKTKTWSHNPKVEVVRLRAALHEIQKKEASANEHLEKYKAALRHLLETFDPDQQGGGRHQARVKTEDRKIIVKNAAALLRFSSIKPSLWALHALSGLTIAEVVSSIDSEDLLARELMLEIGMYKSSLVHHSSE